MQKVISKIIIIFLIITLVYFAHIYFNPVETSFNNINEAKNKNIEIAYGITNNNALLYDKEQNIIGDVSESLPLKLAGFDSDGEYIKLKDFDYYIRYNNISSIDDYPKDNSYDNYIVFNENIITIPNAKLYLSDNIYYTMYSEQSLPIIIKEDYGYYVKLKEDVVFVNKKDVKSIVQTTNTDKDVAKSIAVLNYHFVINKSVGENLECTQEICITDDTFNQQMEYLKNNNYYTPKMEEFEMFILGKARLPKNSVLITIDDGWYVQRSITILEKYDLHATLFLIGSLAPPSDYQSENLEIHSHSWNLHNLYECPGYLGGGITCLDREYILNDLKKSKESLNNTTYFCYPFYEYNNYAISLLKESGFTMAFIGGNRKAVIGENRYKIPRFSITKNINQNSFIRIIN